MRLKILLIMQLASLNAYLHLINYPFENKGWHKIQIMSHIRYIRYVSCTGSAQALMIKKHQIFSKSFMPRIQKVSSLSWVLLHAASCRLLSQFVSSAVFGIVTWQPPPLRPSSRAQPRSNDVSKLNKVCRIHKTYEYIICHKYMFSSHKYCSLDVLNKPNSAVLFTIDTTGLDLLVPSQGGQKHNVKQCKAHALSALWFRFTSRYIRTMMSCRESVLDFQQKRHVHPADSVLCRGQLADEYACTMLIGRATSIT